MAADPRIVQYIKEQMDAGFRKAQIQDALMDAGWYKEEIDEAFYEVAKGYQIQPARTPQSQPTAVKQPAGQQVKTGGKKHRAAWIASAVVVATLIFLATMILLGFFNPLVYFSSNYTIQSDSRNAKGFSGIGIVDWQYYYDGNFSIILKNTAEMPITATSVTADCAGDGNSVVLETMEPTYLEPGANITYSTGGEKCLLREPGEHYSVSVITRYVDKNNLVISSSGVVEGNVAY